MTSSLVGSEMCIRDRRSTNLPTNGSRLSTDFGRTYHWCRGLRTPLFNAVSYTHLTLPTICSV
eukprot:12817375-Prorocentrum_lima.AAC.1